MENYEQKYKAALGWMQGLYNGLHGKTKEEAEKFFPELKESKDEKIRKAVVEMVNDTAGYDLWVDYNVRKQDALAWLEKQGSLRDIIDRYKDSWYNEGKIAGMAEGLTDDEKYQQGWHDALEKQGEQKADCSEEDEKIRKALIRFHKTTINCGGVKGSDIIAWLEKQGDGQLDQEIQKATNENFFDMIGEEDTIDKLISLNKACEWLTDKLDYCEIECYDEKKLINDFKQAMEGNDQ